MTAADASLPHEARFATPAVVESLHRLKLHNPAINAFSDVTGDRARAQAAALDEARDKGLPLIGLTFAAKNLFDVTGRKTAAGSIINLDAAAAAQDAVAVRLLSEAGAVLVGTTNMDEFAYGFTSENSHFGAVRNPHDHDRTAGGSSGGSAAAVAAGIVPLALGTDTNGSIRVPAACCGVFGFKPSFGRVGMDGAFPFVEALDHVGLFAANAMDLAQAGRVLLRSREGVIKNARPRLSRTDRADSGLRIGILDQYFDRYMDDAVRRAFESFTASFVDAIPVTLACAEEIRAAAVLLTAREGGERHCAMLRSRYDDFDPNVRVRLAAGLLVEDDWLAKAQQVLAWARRQAPDIFTKADILLAPAIPCLPPRLGQETIVLGTQEMPTRLSLGLLTQPLTPMGLPIVSAPLASAEELPVGVQIIAPHGGDEALLGFVAHLEARGLLRPFSR